MTTTKKQRKQREIKRNPLCGRLLRDMRKQGVEVQTLGIGPDNECVYAGVHFIPELCPKWLWRLHNHWARWRKWYDNLPENRQRNYPAKQCPQVIFTGAHIIDDNDRVVHWLKIS